MTRGKAVMLDTNILLAATNSRREDHKPVLELFPAARSAGVHLALCGQILREYLVAATRPAAVNGLGLNPGDALKNCRWFRDQTFFVEEGEAVHEELTTLVLRNNLSGKRIHDANIAAVMLCGGIDAVITLNGSDFAGLGIFGIHSPAEALDLLKTL